MRWGLSSLFLVFLALVSPALAQDKEAEKLYGDFDKKIKDAKSLKFDFTLDAHSEKVSVKGVVTLAPGNKMRISFEGEDNGKKIKGLYVSDGMKFVGRFETDGKPENKDEKTPEVLGEYLKAFLVKAGLFIGIEKSTRPRPEFSPDKLTVADLKTVKGEKITGIESTCVEMKLVVEKEKDLPTAKVWFDAKSGLAVKRVLEFPKDGKAVPMITETYANWGVDPVLGKDEFALPK